jgi:hypothetical protein
MIRAPRGVGASPSRSTSDQTRKPVAIGEHFGVNAGTVRTALLRVEL